MSIKSGLLSVLFLAAYPAASLLGDDLAQQFAKPENVARPGTWWRWINGNVSKEGIARDLHEMARQGIRSVGIFDVDGPAPVATVGMMRPDWREMFRFTVEEAAKLGMEVQISPSAGWGIGGPWIDESRATKTLHSVEIRVEGSTRFDGILPHAQGPASYYKDVAVLAVRESKNLPPLPVQVTASSAVGGYQKEENWPPDDVVDHDQDTVWRSAEAPSAKHPVWIELHYPRPETFASVFVASAPNAGPENCQLQASEDGQTFRDIASLHFEKGASARFDFAPTTAKIFRFSISAAYAPDIQLGELQLLRENDEAVVRHGIKYWWFKSGNRGFWDWPAGGPKALDEEYKAGDNVSDCRSSEVVDLTSRMSADGRLRWDVPPGHWTIIRFGAVLLGESSRWMSRALQGGYEADPYSPEAAETLYDNTAGVLAKDVGALAGKTFTGIVVDSYEIGATAKGLQGTWTEDFRAQFIKRRGYDPIRFLPAMARRVVDSRDVTDRFLTDYRDTLADLYLEFYRRLGERAHRDGLRLWAENGYGSYPFQHIDGLAAFGVVDVPMGEFWYNRSLFTQFYTWADVVRTAASAAHVYGKPLVANETLTIANGLLQMPSEWKITLDREFANGMNLVTLNCWSLQYNVKSRPGLYTYDIVNENTTWWDQSSGFLDYLARCQFLLRQGLPVADVCYFYGEGTCKFVPSREYMRPGLPAGYEFDAIDATAMEQRLASKNGRLVLPEGISYRYLVMPETPDWKATPEAVRAIQSLVRNGATIVGARPEGILGLGRDGHAAEVRSIASSLWGDSASGQKHAGRVLANQSLAELLKADGVEPDLDARGMTLPEKILWCHRRTDSMDIYFLSNQTNEAQAGTISFRVNGKQPELWDPLTGAQRDAQWFAAARTQTEVPVELAPAGSLFVVFRRAAAQAATPRRGPEEYKTIQNLTAEWLVTFDPASGGLAQPLALQKLEDWSKRAEPQVRYYSGKAVYHTTFDLPAGESGRTARWFLDLGAVRNMARVRINGQDLGVLWTAPWRVALTGHTRPTNNELEIEIVNTWNNRLIGDLGLPPEQRLTDTNFQRLKANSPLSESGLLGPVALQILQAVP